MGFSVVIRFSRGYMILVFLCLFPLEKVHNHGVWFFGGYIRR